MNKLIRKNILKLSEVENLNISTTKKVRLFNKIENNLLYKIKNEKNLTWDYIKYNINKPKNSEIKFSVFKKILNFFRLFDYRNYIFLLKKKKIDIVFFSHPRPVKINNYLYDEFTDHIIQVLKKKFNIISFSSPHYKYGLNVDYYHKRYSTSFLNFLAMFSANLNLRFKKYYRSENHDLIKNIYRVNEFKKKQEKIWYKYLKKTKPKSIVLVDRISNCPIVRAARRLKIIVIELQHGSPSKYKIDYSNKFFFKKENNPDFYFSFGKFWNNQLFKSYYNKKIYIIGKNFKKKIPTPSKKSKNFLVIDDVHSRDELIKKAILIRKKYRCKITYRLHPNYLNLNYKDQNLLTRNNIKISDSSTVNLKSDLRGVKNIICNYTTLAFECSHMNYNVFILNTNFYEKDFYKKIISRKKFLNMFQISSKKIRSNNFYDQFNKDIILNFFKKIHEYNFRV